MKRIVVADTSPILYLHLIREIELLRALFAEIHLPGAVYDELCHPATPQAVRAWALGKPDWISITPAPGPIDPETASLDEGERAAFDAAVSGVAAVSARLLAALETNAPKKNREAEATRAKERGTARFGD